MSYIRAITAIFRLDKLTNGIKHMLTGDMLTIASYYIMIIFNMMMIEVVIGVFKWLLYVSC